MPGRLPFRDPRRPIEQRVQDLLSRLTLVEKVGQMSHAATAVPRLGIPQYNWWNECLHGIGRAGRATVFPQPIALAAMFDAPLVRRIATAISDEGRAKYNAAQRIGNRLGYAGLTFWSPNINIFRDPRWGRGHETYGECPYLTSRLAVAFIRGMQGDDLVRLKSTACAKHFAVHSGPEAGRHAFDSRVSTRDLWDTYLPAFEACVTEARVEAVMGAYNRLNGVPCCAHPMLLGEILRGKWGFQGHVVSDCGAIEDFVHGHKTSLTPEAAAAQAVSAGCDLCCGGIYRRILAAVEQGLLSEAEIDTCARRLLLTRFRLGMFDPPARDRYRRLGDHVVNSPRHRKLALHAARESIVLLKNDGLLPLPKNLKKIVLCGPNLDSLEVLQGNYNGNSPRMVTFLEGITAAVSAGTIVTEIRRFPLTGPASAFDPGPLRWLSEDADVVIAVMGLAPRIEGEEGDAFAGEAGGDRSRIELPDCQLELLKTLKEIGKPTVLVLAGGSAIAVPWAQAQLNAIVQVWYPGEEGGTALADVLFGDVNPAGRLPITVPMQTEDLPEFTDYSMTGRTYRYATRPPLYPFGFGLSYTTFAYSRLKTSARRIVPGGQVRVSATVANTGRRAGDEVVQLYVRDIESSCTAPRHALRGFRRIHLRPKERREVSFDLRYQDLAIVTESGERIVEPGEFQVFVGGGQPDFAPTRRAVIRAERGQR